MLARLPSVNYRNNPSSVLGNVLEDRLGEIEVFLGRVTPSSWWAEISGGDHNGASEAPFWIIYTSDLKARPAA